MNLLAEAMKQGILDDMRNGIVPYSTWSFSALHNFVDANCYGGLCDDAVIEGLIAFFGGRDDDGVMPYLMPEYINDAQNEVDCWLKSGRMR